MNEHIGPGFREEEGAADSLVSLRGLAQAIRRHRPLFFAFSLGLPLVTAVVLLFTDNKFTSGGVILVETPESGLGMAGELLGQFSSFTGIAAQGSPTDIFLAILRSRRVAVAVAEELGLPDYYEVKGDGPEERMDKTLRKLGKRATFESPDVISIHVSVTDSDPQKAADIVNAYLRQLEQASQTLAFSRARRTRLLVEEALDSTKTELNATRERMLEFQERYGVFSIEKQTEGTLELLTGLQTQLLTAQAQRDALREYTSEHSSRLQGLDLQIRALRDQIEDLVGNLQSGTGAARVQAPQPGGDGRVVVPLNELPQLASQYARIFIDLQVQEAKYNVLATQLEQTKIDESQSVPTFEILDWGSRPFRKSGPFRTLFTLAALVGGTLTGLLLVVLLEDLSRRIDPRTREEYLDLVPTPVRAALGKVTRSGATGKGRRRSSLTPPE